MEAHKNELSHSVWKLRCSGQTALSPVRVTEKKDGLLDAFDQRNDILCFVQQSVPLSRVGLSPATAGNGPHRKLFLKDGLDDLPVGDVIAETAVHEHERWSAAVLGVRHGDALPCSDPLPDGRGVHRDRITRRLVLYQAGVISVIERLPDWSYSDAASDKRE